MVNFINFSSVNHLHITSRNIHKYYQPHILTIQVPLRLLYRHCTIFLKFGQVVLQGNSWWRLEWYIMHSGTIPQISPTFGKILLKFPEKLGNLVKISGIQSNFREFSQTFGNLNWIFQWISWKFQWFEYSSKLLIYYWIFNLLKFYGILVIPTEILNHSMKTYLFVIVLILSSWIQWRTVIVMS